ncbi:uncharacterized protein L969DRAFT_50632 [Mixia osmundae IAM 14324]|uniref:Nitrite reductase [NAD(P)H] n=1 Tax=Mixia osmundae (strain CBS 9802 / IAM 14324 / JCM 22182 / KY 12970) TaxID=764103 RepID=G7E7I7_MIXOS|nr:uncharacterized protein L969DRAFT_50632 [Mixia osmundae IAM 14324]KEI38399.1 hypothetical protein L969DRAFT_50632 [Mixia osmundae IAM 14324]GAA98797.1 hypothetical protein E5Q_05485 [Mixia osmundae IAM 14324]
MAPVAVEAKQNGEPKGEPKVIPTDPPALDTEGLSATEKEALVPQDERKVIFVVGLGMVGIAFIEKMLNLDTEGKYFIVTCGEEQHLAYNRVGLTEYFEHRNVDDLLLNPPSWYAKHSPSRFAYHLGETVLKIDPEAHTVHTDKNHIFKYDYCVLATGSGAGLPPFVSEEQARETAGVFVYRNIADLEKIIDYGDKDDVTRAVVVGGGLLGLEAAKAVYDLPTVPDVSIINRQAFPLSRQLDADAGEMVLRKIEAMGVSVLTNVAPTEMVTESDPETGKPVFKGFKMTDGTVHDADLVIFSIGIKPRDELARQSGIECHKRGGVVVHEDLQTSAKDVYALGEVANWKGNTYGLISPGIEMADILSFNLTQTGGHAPRKMNDPDLSTKLKLMGVDVASFGDFFADQSPYEKQLQKVDQARHQSQEAQEAAKPNGDGKKAMNGESHATVTVELDEDKKTQNGTLQQPMDKQNKPSGTSLDNPPEDGSKGDNQTAEKPDSKTVSLPKVSHSSKSARKDEPIKCLTYKDPFGSIYKKYIFSADGKYLLGGMMIGDVSDYVKLVSIVKKRKPLDMPPSQFIIGAKSGGEDDGGDLDDDVQVCSCHNVVKGQIASCVKDGCTSLGDLKTSTKAGTGCGGCMPLITGIFNAEMKKAGVEANTDLCPHFAMSRQDLFMTVKVKELKTLQEIMTTLGNEPESIGCEICKPAIGSILSSIYNEHIMKPAHIGNQDSNDKYLANIQRNGTFSVIPRMAGGEVKPEGLIVIGEVARDYGLYTKITGGVRIDMFGAKRADLPDIWERLIKAGFESGHAYGKSLRTVKSCVGTTWCRYGIGDSVGLAIQLENRYRGVRSPHKFKGGVSGCIRECAEAQGKDFGLIATDKGWNIFVGGNGGSTPRHATLFATDVPPSKVIKILDRFLMFYIRTADRLQRTARWVESFDGGIEKLKKIILQDELGICGDLEREMEKLVGTYECEWKKAVETPEIRKQFRQFINTDERVDQAELITERGQKRPADWPKNYEGIKMSTSQISTPKEQWKWIKVAHVDDLRPNEENTSHAALKYGESQLALYHVPRKGYFATQQMCPHKRAFVLDHGIVGDGPKGLYVACPLHKRGFQLETGECLNDEQFSIMSFEAREDADGTGDIEVLLPPKDALDAVLGTDKWLVKQAQSEALGLNAATQIKIVGPEGAREDEPEKAEGGGGCGSNKLEW